MSISYNYINTLKQLPRHGTNKKKTDAVRKYSDALTEANQKQVNLEQEARLISGNQEKQTNIIDTLTTSYYNLAAAAEANTKGAVKQQVGLNKLIAIQESFGKSLIEAAKASTFLEQRNKELNKAFGINSKTAAELGDSYDFLSKSFGTGGKQIRKYAQSLNAILPLQAKNLALNTKTSAELVQLQKQPLTAQQEAQNSVNRELLETQKLFQENLGLSGEQANSFSLFAASAVEGSTGAKSVAAQLLAGVANSKELGGAVGVTRTILGDIANLSQSTQLQFSQMPKGLGLAVMKARMLGVSLDKVYDIGKNLLNIESSVNNELEYQLLSGKRLINQNGESLTQKYREATLNGDALGMQNTLLEIVESQGDEIKTNFMARKKLAETLGIGEDKLSAMVQQRELLADMGPAAEGILELQGEELATAIESFKKDATKPQLEAFDKLVKQQANTMTTDERMLYYLETLTTGVIGDQVKLTSGGSAALVQATQDAFAGDVGKAQMKSDLGSVNETFFGGKTNDAIVNTLGAMGKLSIASGKAKDNLNTIAKTIPFFGGLVSKLADKINNLTFTDLNTLNASTTGDIIVTSTTGTGNLGAGSSTGTSDKAVATTVNGKTIQDGIIFHPRDKFMQVDDATMIAGTNEGGNQALARAINGMQGGQTIDYNKMAMAMVSAMKNVTITAPTDIFAESKMNTRSIG